MRVTVTVRPATLVVIWEVKMHSGIKLDRVELFPAAKTMAFEKDPAQKAKEKSFMSAFSQHLVLHYRDDLRRRRREELKINPPPDATCACRNTLNDRHGATTCF